MMRRFRFHHPLYDGRTLTLALPEETLLRDVTQRLYQEGFVAPKQGGYQYIIDGHMGSLGRSLACYLPEGCGAVADVFVRNLLIS